MMYANKPPVAERIRINYNCLRRQGRSRAYSAVMAVWYTWDLRKEWVE